MIDKIETIEQARAHRYNEWGGNPNGTAYKEGRCAHTVWKNYLSYQCNYKNGKGLNGLLKYKRRWYESASSY